MSKLTFTQKVAKIQKELKAPKSQYNSFGKYNYRNQEDILEAVKPLLVEQDLVLTLSDNVIEVGGKNYIQVTAKIQDGEGSSISNSSLAREPNEQKGMNESMLSGTASSYARKYCLNGLFLIDDTKDADTDAVTALTKGEKMPEQKAAPAKVVAKPVTATVVKEESKVVTSTPAAPVKKGFATSVRRAPVKPATTSNSSEDLY